MEKTIAYAAPRMRMMRKLMKMDEDKTEEVDMIDFVYAMQKLHEEDNAKFVLRFQYVEPNNILHSVIFDEDIIKGQPLPRLKKWVENVLRTDKRVAISFVFNQHIATGCFEREVEFV